MRYWAAIWYTLGFDSIVSYDTSNYQKIIHCHPLGGLPPIFIISIFEENGGSYKKFIETKVVEDKKLNSGYSIPQHAISTNNDSMNVLSF